LNAEEHENEHEHKQEGVDLNLDPFHFEYRVDYVMNFLEVFNDDDFAVGYNQRVEKQQVVVSKCLAVDIGNQQPLFVCDDIQDYMFSSFGHGFLLHDQRNLVDPDCHEINYAQALLFKEQGDQIFLKKKKKYAMAVISSGSTCFFS